MTAKRASNPWVPESLTERKKKKRPMVPPTCACPLLVDFEITDVS